MSRGRGRRPHRRAGLGLSAVRLARRFRSPPSGGARGRGGRAGGDAGSERRAARLELVTDWRRRAPKLTRGPGCRRAGSPASPTVHQSQAAQRSRYAPEPRTGWELSAGGGDCGKGEPIGTEGPRPSAVMDRRVRANRGIVDSKKSRTCSSGLVKVFHEMGGGGRGGAATSVTAVMSHVSRAEGSDGKSRTTSSGSLSVVSTWGRNFFPRPCNSNLHRL